MGSRGIESAQDWIRDKLQFQHSDAVMETKEGGKYEGQ
jgi:hypothetical protein